jgi:hypothetical protein
MSEEYFETGMLVKTVAYPFSLLFNLVGHLGFEML